MNTVLENVVGLQEKLYQDYEIILVLWEMRELWEYSQKSHQKLIEKAINISKNIFLVWADMKKYAVPVLEWIWVPVNFYQNSYLLWKDLKKILEENSQKKYLILFKWSQNTIFLEEAVKWCLAEREDEKLLCRQEDFWQEKKQLFFRK
jgi:UDP-N-acetylmuramyl pentapeptide synthase